MGMTTRAASITSSTPLTHLSWSAVSEYRMCAKRFFYRRIERAAEERTSATLIHGSAIHRAAEMLHRCRLARQPMPAVARLVGAYDSTWSEAAAAGIPVAFNKTDTAASLRALAEGMLQIYRQHAERQCGNVVGIEMDATVRGRTAVPILSKLDLVLVDGDELIISDLKTARGRYSNLRTGEGLPQLALYVLAAKRIVQELGLRKAVPQFVVLTKTRVPVVQVIRPRVTTADINRSLELVDETAAAVRAGVFPRREGWQCRDCPFRDRCLGKPADVRGKKETANVELDQGKGL